METNMIRKQTCLAVDVGYSNIKFAWHGPDGVERSMCIPSGAAPLTDMPKSSQGRRDLAGGTLVQISDGEMWVAGINHRDAQKTERTLDARYPESKQYLANFLAAVELSGVGDRIDLLVVGLPVSQYYAAGGAAATALQKRLLGTHYPRHNRAVTVMSVSVIPQPLGACFAAMDADPDLQDPRKRLLCVDPGFFSVDWVVVSDGAVRDESSGTTPKATSAILDEVRADIENLGIKVSVERLEEFAREGVRDVEIGGRKVDLGGYFDRAATSVGDDVAKAILRSLRKESDSVDRVIIGGGGASYYARSIKRAFGPLVTIPANPVMLNAKGYLMWGADQVAG
jgi:plasmid segregation protein ParM